MDKIAILIPCYNEAKTIEKVVKDAIWTFPILSKGFEIETEMTIHAVTNNMHIENVVVDYRDRPEGSVFKLNTFLDGRRLLVTITNLYKNC